MAASAFIQAPVLPFASSQETKAVPESIAADHSILEIDRELDLLFDKMQEELEESGVASSESIERFHAFCDAYGKKVDRILATKSGVVSQSKHDPVAERLRLGRLK